MEKDKIECSFDPGIDFSNEEEWAILCEAVVPYIEVFLLVCLFEMFKIFICLL
jgi:hypothetical protein